MIRLRAAALIVLTGAAAWTGTAWAQTSDAALVGAPTTTVHQTPPEPTPPVTPLPTTPLPRVDAVFAAEGVTITDGGKSVLV